MVVASEAAVSRLKLKPLARLVGYAVVGVEPSIMAPPMPSESRFNKPTKHLTTLTWWRCGVCVWRLCVCGSVVCVWRCGVCVEVCVRCVWRYGIVRVYCMLWCGV